MAAQCTSYIRSDYPGLELLFFQKFTYILFSSVVVLALAWKLGNVWPLVCWPYPQHRKKRFTSFPSPAGMSLTKLPLGRNNSVMTSLFPPWESLVVTSRLGTGNSRTFFYGVTRQKISAQMEARGH